MSETREREFWTPEPLWLGQTCFLLGGGPSLIQPDCDRLRGRNVVAINSSCHKAPWAPVLFFTDNNWFEDHRRLIVDWPGMVITTCRQAKRELPDRMKRVEGQACLDGFPPLGHPGVRQGRSSGHTAVSVVIGMGVNRIVLLGYDMRIVGGRSHHHDDYQEASTNIYETEFVPGFDGWNAAARRAGVEIINATPDSALTEFPCAALDDILRDEES